MTEESLIELDTRDQVMAWPGDLEVRQVGGAREIVGKFRYGSLGTVADRGVTRKEMFMPDAFAYAINTPERRIDLLVGHNWGQPVASRQSGTLVISSSPESVDFIATLPAEALTASWVTDAEKSIKNGTMVGLSPGYVVPPLSVVPGAEDLIPEPGNPGVKIRRIFSGVLREMSIVTSPVYIDAMVELRDEQAANVVLFVPRRLLLCL